MWMQSIDWKKFGSFVQISNEQQNERLKKIDLSDAKLFSASNSTAYYEGNSKYITLKIDTLKFYWNPVEECINTGEFYTFDAGFKMVEPFYSILFGFNGNFNIDRMKGMDVFYNLGKCEFRPEFNTYSQDNKDNKIAHIIKEPKIQFKYKEKVTEEEAIFYSTVVSCLASFYHHVKINYSLCRIHLPDYTITIKKIEQKKPLETTGNLWGFNILWDFHNFLEADWQESVLKNFKILSKAIELFNQALLVDANSEFLIRYNLLEICDKGNKLKSVKYKFVLKDNEVKKRYNQALNLLLETIDKKDHMQYKNKWTSLIGKLEYKPLKSSLVSFLESQNLKTSEFPISIDKLKSIRDCITHGSINKIDSEELEKTNKFLYRINGILILNLMGINAWKLKTEL
jgi:hypothetical protein